VTQRNHAKSIKKSHTKLDSTVFAPIAGCLVAVAVLSGCAGLIPPSANKAWLDNHSYLIAAESLKPIEKFERSEQRTDGRTSGAPSGVTSMGPMSSDVKYQLGKVLDDSQTKCDNFMRELQVAETSANAGLDFVTNVFSALGTAFTPLSTVHALTAAGTITGGWKSALDSDLYAKATIANYSQAILSTYTKDMKTYSDALKSADPNQVIFSIEYRNIKSIHSECSLAAAQASISATLQGGAPTAQSTQQTQTVTIDGPVQPNEVITLVASSSSFKTAGQTVTARYTIPAANPYTDDAAAGLTNFVNSAANFKTYQITAANPNPPSSTVVLTWPSSLSVTWSRPSGTPPSTAGRRALRSARIGSLGPVTDQVSPQSLSGVVAGHSIR
jgi:hypothetical protein